MQNCLFYFFSILLLFSSVVFADDWEFFYTQNQINHKFENIYYLNSDNIIVFGSSYSDAEGGSKEHLILKMNDQGKIIKEKKYSYDIFTKLIVMAMYRKEELFVLGKNNKNKYVLLKLDNDMSLIDMNYSLPEDHHFVGMSVNSKNNLIIFGAANGKSIAKIFEIDTGNKINEIRQVIGKSGFSFVSGRSNGEVNYLLELQHERESNSIFFKQYSEIGLTNKSLLIQAYDSKIIGEGIGNNFVLYDKRDGIRQEIHLASINDNMEINWDKVVLINDFGLEVFQGSITSGYIMVAGNKRNRIFWSLLDAKNGLTVHTQHYKNSNPVTNINLSCFRGHCVFGGTSIHLDENNMKLEKIIIKHVSLGNLLDEP